MPETLIGPFNPTKRQRSGILKRGLEREYSFAGRGVYSADTRRWRSSTGLLLLRLAGNAYSTASGCYRESATLAVEIGDFKNALERWEQVAAMSLESNLTRYNVKDYYLSAGCCYLAIPVS